MTQNQIILAIETSTTACSAALLVQSVHEFVVYESWQDAPRLHTELILPMIDDVLEQAACSLADVDALAFGCGPGAFTGVRIASSVAQAIAYAGNLKVIPVSSLAALAQGVFRIYGQPGCFTGDNSVKAYHNIVVINDARMGEIYLGCYKNVNANMTLIGEEQLIKPQFAAQHIENFCRDNPQWVGAGSGWTEYKVSLESQFADFPFSDVICNGLPHAQDIAVLALQKLDNEQFTDAIGAVPVYLRNDVAKKTAEQKLENA